MIPENLRGPAIAAAFLIFLLAAPVAGAQYHNQCQGGGKPLQVPDPEACCTFDDGTPCTFFLAIVESLVEEALLTGQATAESLQEEAPGEDDLRQDLRDVDALSSTGAGSRLPGTPRPPKPEIPLAAAPLVGSVAAPAVPDVPEPALPIREPHGEHPVEAAVPRHETPRMSASPPEENADVEPPPNARPTVVVAYQRTRLEPHFGPTHVPVPHPEEGNGTAHTAMAASRKATLPGEGAFLLWSSAIVTAVWLAAAATAMGALYRVFALSNRLAGDRVLDNPVRRAIFDHIRKYPGTNCAGAAQAAGVAFNTARRHLRVLVRFGHVVAFAEGTRERYFENHGRYPPELKRHLSLLRRPENVAFLREVTGAPHASISELARRLDIDKSTASRRAALLRAAGLIQVTPGGNVVQARAWNALNGDVMSSGGNGERGSHVREG